MSPKSTVIMGAIPMLLWAHSAGPNSGKAGVPGESQLQSGPVPRGNRYQRRRRQREGDVPGGQLLYSRRQAAPGGHHRRPHRPDLGLPTDRPARLRFQDHGGILHFHRPIYRRGLRRAALQSFSRTSSWISARIRTAPPTKPLAYIEHTPERQLPPTDGLADLRIRLDAARHRGRQHHASTSPATPPTATATKRATTSTPPTYTLTPAAAGSSSRHRCGRRSQRRQFPARHRTRFLADHQRHQPLSGDRHLGQRHRRTASCRPRWMASRSTWAASRPSSTSSARDRSTCRRPMCGTGPRTRHGHHPRRHQCSPSRPRVVGAGSGLLPLAGKSGSGYAQFGRQPGREGRTFAGATTAPPSPATC